MSDFKNIVEFLRLNRRSEEAEKNQTIATDVSLEYLEDNTRYDVDKNIFENFDKYKRIVGVLESFKAENIYLWETNTDRKYFVKTPLGKYYNLLDESTIAISSNDLTEFSIDFPTNSYFYDIEKNRIVFSWKNINDVIIFRDIIHYDPNSYLLEDFGHEETLNYDYKTNTTWLHDLLVHLIPNNDAEGDPFEKYVSDSDVTVAQIRIPNYINIIPVLSEANGKHYVKYTLYKKEERKIVPFYANRPSFADESTEIISLKFNSLGAFMSYLNDTLFSQTEKFSFGKRTAFLEQYKEIVITPLIKNLASSSSFSYKDALQTLYYLPESLFYMLPEEFLWDFFEKAIANNSFTNKPKNREEDIFLKILKVLALSEKNAVRLIERLTRNVGEKNPQMLFQFFYDRIHGDNFKEFAALVHRAWFLSNYKKPDNPLYTNIASPFIVNYEADKKFTFFYSNMNISWTKNNLLKYEPDTSWWDEVTTAIVPALGEVVKYFVETEKSFYYHPFQPIAIAQFDKQKTGVALTAPLLPAFMLKAGEDVAFWENVVTATEYAVDVITTFSGVGNIAKFRFLAKVASKANKLKFVSRTAKVLINVKAAARAAVGVIEISSGTVNALLKLTDQRDEPWAKELSEFLLILELCSLGADLGEFLLKRARTSAKNALQQEDEIRKTAKNADEAKQIDEIILELRKVANESTVIAKSRLYRVQGGKVKPNISKFRFIFRNSKLEIVGKDRLHITFDDVERAIEFYIKRGDKAEVFTANINKSFLDKIKSEAVKQNKAKKYPTRPQIDDPSKTKGSFGLHESYFEELLKNISNPQIIKKQ